MTCHDVTTASPTVRVAGQLTIALAGQPNVGKTTVFNMLTGLNQHVGNWPGKTVEQKTGICRRDGVELSLVDLPGTYSLTANSEEERIARDFLIRERPDIVIAVVNAAQLERSLYLIAELLALGQQPIVVGLNMSDVAEQHGIHVEPHVLAAALGVPVVALVAAKNRGVGELLDAAIELAQHPESYQPNRPAMRPQHLPIFAEVLNLVHDAVPPSYPTEWITLKLLEGDKEIVAMMQSRLTPPVWAQVHSILLTHEDAYLDIAGGRYEWIGRMVRAAVTRPRAGAVTRTDRIDRLATHPVVGLLVLLTMFGLVFWLTYTLATPLSNWLSETVLGGLAALATTLLASAPAWLAGLIADGLIAGVGTVLTFLPILILFYVMLGVLEDVGYLARGAYVMDRFMHLMGLHGKSFLPLFLGFGCNVPAVLGSRIVEEKRARNLTILLAPFVPCTARMAVLAFLVPAFFGAASVWVTWGMVGASLLALAIVGVVVNRFVYQGQQSAFVMELPLYHVPNARTVGLYVWNNTIGFVKKAGTLILVASMVVWALSTMPGNGIDQSYLALFGQKLESFGRLMGIGDWRIIVALITSFFAKENTIATLGVLYGTGEGLPGLAQQVALVMTPAARLAFLTAYMLFVPCLATTATIRSETRSWRFALSSVALMLAVSLAAGVVVFQIGSLL